MVRPDRPRHWAGWEGSLATQGWMSRRTVTSPCPVVVDTSQEDFDESKLVCLGVHHLVL